MHIHAISAKGFVMQFVASVGVSRQCFAHLRIVVLALVVVTVVDARHHFADL